MYNSSSPSDYNAHCYSTARNYYGTPTPKDPGYMSYGASLYYDDVDGKKHINVDGKTRINNNSSNSSSAPVVPLHRIDDTSFARQLHRDWNLDFQKVLQMPKDDPDQQFARAVAIRNLANDFTSVAGAIAKVIIAEKHFSPNNKSIPPILVGGIAGGEKYLSQNILFKFAIDTGIGLFDSDENAMKVANAELRGLMNFIDCNIHGLCFPLMALIDYLGYRLVATSLLPISASTIAYGSSDAGITVHDGLKAPDLLEKIRHAAKMLNLKPHVVKGMVMYSAVDMEAHIGKDGRYYIVDTARTFPPSAPVSGIHGAQHLWNFLRPELTQNYPQPLSSDAFSAFGRDSQSSHNMEVEEATQYLKQVLIPECAAEFERTHLVTSLNRMSMKPVEQYHIDTAFLLKHIGRLVHRKGINIRYLGILRNYLTSSTLRTAVLVHMIGRTLKMSLRRSLRNIMSTMPQLPGSGTVPSTVKGGILKFFSMILCKTESEIFWDEIKMLLLEKFDTGLTELEVSQQFSLQQVINGDPQYLWTVLDFLQKSTGISLSPKLNHKIKRGKSITAITLDDLSDPGVRVKYTNFVFHDEGESLVRLARLKACSGEADRLLCMAVPALQQALSIKPNDIHSSAVLGEALTLQGMAMGSTREASMTLLAAEQKYDECLEIQNDYVIALQGLAFTTYQRAMLEHTTSSSRYVLLMKAARLFARCCNYPTRVNTTNNSDRNPAFTLGDCYLYWGMTLMAISEFCIIPQSTRKIQNNTIKKGPIPPVTHSTYPPPPPPPPPPGFWLTSDPTKHIRVENAVSSLDSALHKFHKACAFDSENSKFSLYMAKAYLRKADLVSRMLHENIKIKTKYTFDDADTFYTLAEEIFSSLLSSIDIQTHEVYEVWGRALHDRSKLQCFDQTHRSDLLEASHEKYLLSLADRGLRAPQLIVNNFEVFVEFGNLYGLEIDTHENPHRWTAFVRLPDGNYCVPFLKKVTFVLHPTFTPTKLTFKQEPFSLLRRGWGIFTLQAELHFADCLTLSPVLLSHTLAFQVGGGATVYRLSKQPIGNYCVAEKLFVIKAT